MLSDYQGRIPAQRRVLGEALTDTKKNDRAEMVDKRGLLSENLTDMLHEIQDNAELTRCKNAMYIASFSPAIGEKLTEVIGKEPTRFLRNSAASPKASAASFTSTKRKAAHTAMLSGTVSTPRK